MNIISKLLDDRSMRMIGQLALVAALWISSSSGKAQSNAAESADTAGSVVRIGLPVLTMYGLDPADARLAMDRIFELAWDQTAQFKSEIYENDKEFYQAIIDGNVDIAPMLIEEFLNRPPGCDVDPVLQGVDGESGGGTELILLAREELDLKGLAGSKLLLDSAQQLSVAWLDLVLADEDLPEHARHFGIVGRREKTKEAVLQTFFGQADACVTSKQAFDLLAELNPQLRKKLKVVAMSEPMAMHVICVATNFDAERRKSLVNSLRELNQKPAGKQLLMLTKINRIDYCDTDLVDSARDIKQRWDALCEKRKVEWIKEQKEHVVAKPVLSAEPKGEQLQ